MAITNAENVAKKSKFPSNEKLAGLSLIGISAWQALVKNIGLVSNQ
jgi:hypothetical protein